MRTDEEVLTPLVEAYLAAPSIRESAFMIAEYESRVVWGRLWANRGRELVRADIADALDVAEVIGTRVFPEIFSSLTFPFRAPDDLTGLIQRAAEVRANREIGQEDRASEVYERCCKENGEALFRLDLFRERACENMLEHYNALAEGGVRAHERDSETFRDALLNSPEQAINIVYRSAYRNGDVALDKADTFLTQFVSSMSLFYDLMESLLAETGAQRELRRVRIQRYPDELLAGKARRLYRGFVGEQFD